MQAKRSKVTGYNLSVHWIFNFFKIKEITTYKKHRLIERLNFLVKAFFCVFITILRLMIKGRKRYWRQQSWNATLKNLLMVQLFYNPRFTIFPLPFLISYNTACFAKNTFVTIFYKRLIFNIRFITLDDWILVIFTSIRVALTNVRIVRIWL